MIMGWFVLGLVIGLVFAWLFANEFQKIAAAKGYPQKKYFWFSFLFSFAGYLMVVALPDRGNAQTQREAAANDELPEL